MPDAEGERMIEEHRDWVECVLASLPFVEWDRFTVDGGEEEPDFIIYGWIAREDRYKDFVLVTLYPGDHTIAYTTSSSRYSRLIGKTLFGRSGGHMPCLRVEAHFDVPNRVRLREAQHGRR